eukprot:Colp12_sorted_trinity150504_noHs@5249
MSSRRRGSAHSSGSTRSHQCGSQDSQLSESKNSSRVGRDYENMLPAAFVLHNHSIVKSETKNMRNKVFGEDGNIRGEVDFEIHLNGDRDRNLNLKDMFTENAVICTPDAVIQANSRLFFELTTQDGNELCKKTKNHKKISKLEKQILFCMD